jgi:hypothetical protein
LDFYAVSNIKSNFYVVVKDAQLTNIISRCNIFAIAEIVPVLPVPGGPYKSIPNLLSIGTVEGYNVPV